MCGAGEQHRMVMVWVANSPAPRSAFGLCVDAVVVPGGNALQRGRVLNPFSANIRHVNAVVGRDRGARRLGGVVRVVQGYFIIIIRG